MGRDLRDEMLGMGDEEDGDENKENEGGGA